MCVYGLSWLENRFVFSVHDLCDKYGTGEQIVKVCGVQHFKDPIICGSPEGLFLKQVKFGIGHSSSWIISQTCLNRHKSMLFNSFCAYNRTRNVYCLLMGQLIFNSWVFFCLFCWAPGFISLFNWGWLVIRVWRCFSWSVTSGFETVVIVKGSVLGGILSIPSVLSSWSVAVLFQIQSKLVILVQSGLQNWARGEQALLLNSLFSLAFSALGFLEVAGDERTILY